MCFIYSKLSRHNSAIENARKALHLAKDSFLAANSGSEEVKTLGICYHNLGFELEQIKKYDSGLRAYQQAINLLDHHGGNDHENLLTQIKNAYLSLKKSTEKSNS